MIVREQYNKTTPLVDKWVPYWASPKYYSALVNVKRYFDGGPMVDLGDALVDIIYAEPEPTSKTNTIADRIVYWMVVATLHTAMGHAKHACKALKKARTLAKRLNAHVTSTPKGLPR